MAKYLFVGERKSPTAIKRGWSWHDGRLAGKQLFDALHAVGINPACCHFANAYEDCLDGVRARQLEGWTVVGMGKKAQVKLVKANIPHRAMVHPAARGSIRLKERYIDHVRSTLTGPSRHEDTYTENPPHGAKGHRLSRNCDQCVENGS